MGVLYAIGGSRPGITRFLPLGVWGVAPDFTEEMQGLLALSLDDD